MKILGVRVISGRRLDNLVRDYSLFRNYSRDYFYNEFFTKNEKRLITTVYLTTYKNKNNYYIKFTNHLPQPSGVFYNNINDLIGKETLYNSTIVSCERCYMIR